MLPAWPHLTPACHPSVHRVVSTALFRLCSGLSRPPHRSMTPSSRLTHHRRHRLTDAPASLRAGRSAATAAIPPGRRPQHARIHPALRRHDGPPPRRLQRRVAGCLLPPQRERLAVGGPPAGRLVVLGRVQLRRPLGALSTRQPQADGAPQPHVVQAHQGDDGAAQYLQRRAEPDLGDDVK